MLEVYFGDGLAFKSAGLATPMKAGTVLTKNISLQLKDDIPTKATKRISKTLKHVVEFLAGSGPVLNFFFGFATS